MADILTDTADEILIRAISRLENSSVLNRTSPGSKLRVLLDIMSSEMARTQDVAQANSVLALVGGASGPFLDFIGEILGTPRGTYDTAIISEDERALVISTPSGTQNFGLLNGGSDIVIPSGTILQTEDRRVVYRLTSEARLRAAESTAYLNATAIQGGSQGNVRAGALTDLVFTDYSSYPGKKLVVRNLSSIESGDEAERDSLYRFRLQQAAVANKACNLTAIRMALLALPGVSDVRVVDLARGVGTADVILETASMEMSNRLQEQAARAIEQTKALGMDIRVLLPSFVGIKVEVDVRGAQSSFKRSEIQRAIHTELSSLISSLDIGEGIGLNDLAAIILGSHSEITDIGRPGRPLGRITLYRQSPFSSRRIAIAVPLDQNIEVGSEERLVIEGSIAEAVTVNFV